MFDSISVGGRSASAVVVGRFKDKPAHASSKAYIDGSVAEACSAPILGRVSQPHPHSQKSGSRQDQDPAPRDRRGLGRSRRSSPRDASRDLGAALAKAASNIRRRASRSISRPDQGCQARRGAAPRTGRGLRADGLELRPPACDEQEQVRQDRAHLAEQVVRVRADAGWVSPSTNIARDLSQTPRTSRPRVDGQRSPENGAQAGLKCTVWLRSSSRAWALSGAKPSAGPARTHRA